MITGIEFGVLGLTQLQQLPSDLMHLVASSTQIWSRVSPWESSIFISISNLVRFFDCVSIMKLICFQVHA